MRAQETDAKEGENLKLFTPDLFLFIFSFLFLLILSICEEEKDFSTEIFGFFTVALFVWACQLNHRHQIKRRLQMGRASISFLASKELPRKL